MKTRKNYVVPKLHIINGYKVLIHIGMIKDIS